MEAGGPLTVLEIVKFRDGKDADKTEGLKLLLQIINSGRQYKEFLCENGAIRSVAECLGNSNSFQTQETCKQVLHKLAIGNPRHCLKVYTALVALLQARSPSAQKLAALTLRKIHPTLDPKEVGIRVVEPAGLLLRSTDVETQLEGQLLLQEIAKHTDTREAVLIALITLLNPTATDGQPLPLPLSLQQSSSAKLLKILIESHADTSNCIVQLRGVESLLMAMGNNNYADSQKQASICLSLLIDTISDTGLSNRVRSLMGSVFYSEFKRDPENLYTKMTAMQAELLRNVQAID